jgi:hypothetical protein
VQFFYANAGGRRPIQRQPLLVQDKQQVNTLLSVISRNDKNKQLTLLSQRKLALTVRNTLFALKKSLEHLKILKSAASLT